MKLEKILGWIDGLLDCGKFDDVSNNGLQIARDGDDVTKVAFAVDGSAKSVKAASEAGAELLVVHHGISWGGGIRRLTGGEYNVVKAAMDANVALAGFHLPLDANKQVGNNWELARSFRLKNIKPAFSYHGNVIGVTGELTDKRAFVQSLSNLLNSRPATQLSSSSCPTLAQLPPNSRIGVCSGGAGEFAAEAKTLGCDLYVTGEASWGDVIAAENIGMAMICAGHYETETFGVKALMKAMKKALKVSTVFVSLLFCLAFSGSVWGAESVGEAESFPLQNKDVENSSFSRGRDSSAPMNDSSAPMEEEDLTSAYLGLSGSLLLPQGGSRLSRLGGAAFRAGYYFNDWFALEGEASWLENRAGLAARGVVHWKGWDEWDMLFGFSRWDPFFTLGVQGWLPDGQVGPAAGIGLLYYLDDNWALRASAEATLGLDSRTEMIYSLAVGVQYGW